MDDWAEPADEEREPAAAAGTVHRAAAAGPDAIDALAAFLAERSRRPSSSAPARTTRRPGSAWWSSPSGWSSPVFQETFGARAGFPQDHPLYLGTLPADRARLRERLAPYDTLLVVGAPGIPPVGLRARAG